MSEKTFYSYGAGYRGRTSLTAGCCFISYGTDRLLSCHVT